MARERDAYFVVRGYKYQFDQTILRWLNLAGEEELQLECGEDIDVVNSSILRRELGQVKYLTTPMSLRSPPCRIAIAHAVAHFNDNRSETRVFRFITNAALTSERPSPFDDRKPGIEVWKQIKDGKVAEPDLGIRLQQLLAFLQSLSKPAKGINAETWRAFSCFINSCKPGDFSEFVTRFEWSYSEPNAADIERTILKILQETVGLRRNQVKDAYARLLLFVIRLISKPGPKILRQRFLNLALGPGEQSEQDTLLLTFLQDLFALDSRVQSLESQLRKQNDALEEVREAVISTSFGQSERVSVESEFAINSIAAPPLVRSWVPRTESVKEVQSIVDSTNWCALNGSMGSGKTQLAALLAAQADNYVYVSLSELNAIEANFFLHHFFTQLASKKRQGSVTAAGLASLPAGAIVIVDDVPRFHEGAQLANRLIQIAKQVAQREHKLLTLSHYQIPFGVQESLDDATFAESTAPRFTRDDTRDLLLRLGFTDKEFNDDTLESLHRFSDGNPTLITAIARELTKGSIRNFDASALPNSLVDEIAHRLVQTVDEAESRELLYRLCVVIGSFGSAEVSTVAGVPPTLDRKREAMVPLLGLWVERQSNDSSVVCPLVRQFGQEELSSSVRQDVARALARRLLSSLSITVIDFTKVVSYLDTAGGGLELAWSLYTGIDSCDSLPRAGQKIIYEVASRDQLLDRCPPELALFVKAKLIWLADVLDLEPSHHIEGAKSLLAGTLNQSASSTAGYLLLAGIELAKHDFVEAVRLCSVVLKAWQAGDPLWEERVDTSLDKDNLAISQIWTLVTGIRDTRTFNLWFQCIADLRGEFAKKVFRAPPAVDGAKLALDLPWMHQHEMATEGRDFTPILETYDCVKTYARKHKNPVLEALTIRSEVIVRAEYLEDLPSAVAIAEGFLKQNDESEIVVFVICDVVGRQYLYQKQPYKACDYLQRAAAQSIDCLIDLQCQNRVELSKALAECASEGSAQAARDAVELAKRHYPATSDLLLVSCLGEAAIALGLTGQHHDCFSHLDDAYVLLREKFDGTSDWKARAAYLGNALGFFATMATIGVPPSEDYTVPPRGHLIKEGKAAAEWYDESNHKVIDAAPTLLAMFANAVGEPERSFFWASTGIDEARRRGALSFQYRLAETLIPQRLLSGEIEEALDYAAEASVAFIASFVSQKNSSFKLTNMDALTILGERPNENWARADEMLLFIGVIPAIVHIFAQENSVDQSLNRHQEILDNYAKIHHSDSFSDAASAIGSYLTGSGARELLDAGNHPWGDSADGLRSVHYMLSSFADDSDLGNAAVAHAVVTHSCASHFLVDDPVGLFLTRSLATYWRNVVQKSRFLFRAPAVVESDIDALMDERLPNVKLLLRRVLVGLGISLPAELATTSDWLNS